MKRLFDILAAALGLLLLGPVMLLAAALVKLSSPGPALFRQQRVGRGFRPFWIYKFRTMCEDAPRRGGPITVGEDPRITTAGRWLRKTKLDELPQLVNVLKGEMSLVGPRPEAPRYVELFRRDYEEVLRVRPGITDLASIRYRDEATILGHSPDPEQEYVRRVLPEKIRLAREYIARSSLRLDLGLIAATVFRLVSDRLMRVSTLSVGGVSDADRASTRSPSETAPTTLEQPSMNEPNQTLLDVPFFRPSLGEAEIEEVVACLRSGWLTTGPRTKRFEAEFAAAVGARHAVAVNSCTAALHLAVEALGLQPGQAVLVPAMTFAATAEVVRYQGAVPILVDCDPVTLNMDLADAERKLADLQAGRLPVDAALRPVGVIPVHVGGLMLDMTAVGRFAERHGLWVVEDAAHALPAAFRSSPQSPWQRCGQNTAAVSCFSFYANKTITTGEGGMAATDDPRLADRMRQMSLHGLSHDAWKRYQGRSAWDYRIVAPGYKYNLTDVAAALGIHQLAKAEAMRLAREAIAARYRALLAHVAQIELPPVVSDRVHSWHLFPIRLRLESLNVDRNVFIEHLRSSGVGCSVHWRPLHLHPYYAETFGWQPEHLPVATAVWERLVSLPLFPGMQDQEQQQVIDVVENLCAGHALAAASRLAA